MYGATCQVCASDQEAFSSKVDYYHSGNTYGHRPWLTFAYIIQTEFAVGLLGGGGGQPPMHVTKCCIFSRSARRWRGGGGGESTKSSRTTLVQISSHVARLLPTASRAESTALCASKATTVLDYSASSASPGPATSPACWTPPRYLHTGCPHD